MSIASNIWGKLVMNAAKRGLDSVGALGGRYHIHGNELEYRSHRTYKSRIAQEASRIAIQTAINEIKQLYPNHLKRIQKEKRQVTFDSQMENYRTLISNQIALSDEGFGVVYDDEKNKCIYATDKYGNLISEALMLYYKGDTDIDSQQYYEEPVDIDSVRGKRNRSTANNVASGDATAKKLSVPNFATKIVCHIDLAPNVSISSNKNITLNPVQGRDYSRKELISGGDLQFSVSGEIDSGQSGVYPTTAVQKFVMNMQYGGILTVHHFMFKQLGVTRVLIKDWSLNTPECKNLQPYSFTCVAVEPDEEIQIKDTITALNTELAYADPLGKWEKILLNDKVQQIANNTVSSLLNQTISELTELTSGRI